MTEGIGRPRSPMSGSDLAPDDDDVLVQLKMTAAEFCLSVKWPCAARYV